MTAFASAADDYLATRRALGYKLHQQGQMLHKFVDYLDLAGAEHLTVAHAVAWAKQPIAAKPAVWSGKLGVVRGFARYLQTLDPRTEVPPVGLLPDRGHRALPYIYSEEDITRLVEVAGRLQPPFRADTYQTVICLLHCTGMRVGEVVGLDRSDLDWEAGLVTVRESKYGKSRQLPLHESTIDALRAYATRRDEHGPKPKAPSFFISSVGTRLLRDNVSTVFARLVRDAGLDWSGRRRPPRAHDLRHSFTCATVIAWYRQGLDVQQRLPLLSTWLGHSGPQSTYWYLSAVPELLELAMERLGVDVDQDGDR